MIRRAFGQVGHVAVPLSLIHIYRLEELASGGKIIRPAYKCVQPEMPYVPLNQR